MTLFHHYFHNAPVYRHNAARAGSMTEITLFYACSLSLALPCNNDYNYNCTAVYISLFMLLSGRTYCEKRNLYL
jgi:hypothetical protein